MGTTGCRFEVLVILVIVLLNAALGYVQEAQAEQAVAALQRVATASAAVVRDGVEQLGVIGPDRAGRRAATGRG